MPISEARVHQDLLETGDEKLIVRREYRIFAAVTKMLGLGPVRKGNSTLVLVLVGRFAPGNILSAAVYRLAELVQRRDFLKYARIIPSEADESFNIAKHSMCRSQH